MFKPNKEASEENGNEFLRMNGVSYAILSLGGVVVAAAGCAWRYVGNAGGESRRMASVFCS